MEPVWKFPEGKRSKARRVRQDPGQVLSLEELGKEGKIIKPVPSQLLPLDFHFSVLEHMHGKLQGREFIATGKLRTRLI